MATYTKDIVLGDLNAITESFNNVNDKIQLEKLFTLIMTEFTAVQTASAGAGLAAYTVTTGLQASLEGTLQNVSNALKVEFLKTWITYLVAEFTSVATDGTSYAVTISSVTALETFLDFLNQSISYLPELEKKKGFHEIDVALNAEFVLVAAADT